ncbi:OPT super [Blastocladiella emersonii ATCC 22665]|nr:OPT super [Blastocladiella emersonii ATCC 22665]KAI9189293.1 OPT super [Blastocladiella emersonii ATCC 22665]
MTADEKHLNEKAAEVEGGESSLVMDADFEEMISKVVPTTDDTSLPSFTLRVWIIGTFFCFVLGAINTLFLFRSVAFSVSSYVAILLAYPMGVFMAKTVPSVKFNLFGIEVDTNPGPFSVKEHVLINIFATTGASSIYGIDNLGVQEIFYDLDIGHFWGIAFLFCSATLGFGIAGMCRSFIIRPKAMIWPSILPSVAMFMAFHQGDLHSAVEDEVKADSAGKQEWSQLKMFGIGTLAMTIYTFLPSFVAPMLRYIPLLCFFSPSDSIMQKLGSPTWGPGIAALSLDWTIIGSGPMSVPFWVAVNQLISSIIFLWIVTPLAWQGNWFNQPKTALPLNTTGLFKKDGKSFKGNMIVDKETKRVVDSLYDKVKPIHMTSLFAFAYMGHFASLTSSVTNTIVWHGKDIARQWRAGGKADKNDIHCQLIDKYPEVPNTWYYGFFVFTGILTTIVGHFSGLNTPWWATFFAVALSAFGTVPIAIVLATSGISLYMNVVSQFLIGLILPGQPIVMMAFKCLGVTVSLQCLTLLSDLKLGHYMKVPPRHVFLSQLLSQIMAVFFCYITYKFWMQNPAHREWVTLFGSKAATSNQWTSQTLNTYYSASLIWGAVGPKRFFFESSYAPVIYVGVALGISLPIVLRLCYLFVGGPIPWQLIYAPILLQPQGPSGNQAYHFTGFLVSFFFQFYVYRYRSAWWKKYNYVLATAFDVGSALTSLFITLVIEDQGITFPAWFLNCVDTEEQTYCGYGDWCHIES